MKPIAFLRAADIGLVAIMSAGCVDAGYYDSYPRLYRNHYDRNFARPGYIGRGYRAYRRPYVGRYHRYPHRNYRRGSGARGFRRSVYRYGKIHYGSRSRGFHDYDGARQNIRIRHHH